MNPLSASALFLRRRSVWEASDSGILLWRGNFVHFIPFFVLPVLITACALRLIPPDFRYLSYLGLWWLKPFFDRMVLHVVSHRFFSEPILRRNAPKLTLYHPAPSRFRELCRGLSEIRRGLLGDLLWRRFSPGRAALMPVRILERISGGQFLLRKKALTGGGLNFCSLLSFFGLALEVMLLAGQVLFVIMATRMFLPAAFSYIQNIPETIEILIFAAFCFNYILAGSLYVCMGFGLYINSRVEVEGWDLQLLFQKFAGSSEKFNHGVSRREI